METNLVYFDETGDDGLIKTSSETFILTSTYMKSTDWQKNYNQIKFLRRQLKDKYGFHVKEEMHTKYFLTDRFNFGLKTHFYSHQAMLETMGNPDKKFGFLFESMGIVPEDYKIFDKHKGLNKDFDLIMNKYNHRK